MTTCACLIAAYLAAAAAPPAGARALHLGDRVPLRPGMRGHDVRVLQAYLVRAGWRARVDGVFGPGTARDLRGFERSRGLPVDGAADRADIAALLRGAPAATTSSTGGAEAAAAAFHLGDRILRPGLSGHDVRVLQGYLTRLGYPVGLTGVFDDATLAAQRAFEYAHALAPDGVADGPDVIALRQAIAALPGVAPGSGAMLAPDGSAVAPAGAPPAVAALIAGANRIAHAPYRLGGGHGAWDDAGYDCSGSVSYALHAAGLLDRALDSTELESFGVPGPGAWLTVYANGGHAYLEVAGLRFDTAGVRRGTGRWQRLARSHAGYVVRHVDGL